MLVSTFSADSAFAKGRNATFRRRPPCRRALYNSRFRLSRNDAEDEQEDTEETEMCQWISGKHGRQLRVTFQWAATRDEKLLFLRIHGSAISVTSCSTEWLAVTMQTGRNCYHG